jgi:quinone-modifying oxidoreductase subunit QmoA
MTTKQPAPASGSIMVVGGGISGLTTALEAAEVGYDVFLVEKNPYLGGRVAQLNQYFPKLCPPTCGLEINFRRIKDNPRVQGSDPGRSAEGRGWAGQLQGGGYGQAPLCQ